VSGLRWLLRIFNYRLVLSLGRHFCPAEAAKSEGGDGAGLQVKQQAAPPAQVSSGTRVRTSNGKVNPVADTNLVSDMNHRKQDTNK
jgi:hypothetical protein